ncbi:MAG: 2-hydroxyacid dehydrogenase [Tetrasphaera sp.]
MVRVSFPDADWLADVGAVEGVEPLVWNPRDEPPAEPVDVVVAPYLGAAAKLAAVAGVPGVRLVQLLTAGYDGVFDAVPEHIAVANAAGLHDASTAELALALILASQRGIPGFVRAQDKGEWSRPGFLPSLADRRVLLIGYGSVGRAIVQRLLPFETRVTAVASRPRPGDDLIATVHGIDELPRLLPDAEIVVLVVPLVDSTRHLVDDAFLAALPDDALVVNVARGPVVDTEAVLRHTGRIRFAADVTDPEPLPDGHPLWSAPEVLISPHIGGMSSAMRPRAIALLRHQLGRLGRGEPPEHLVRAGEYS